MHSAKWYQSNWSLSHGSIFQADQLIRGSKLILVYCETWSSYSKLFVSFWNEVYWIGCSGEQIYKHYKFWLWLCAFFCLFKNFSANLQQWHTIIAREIMLVLDLRQMWFVTFILDLNIFIRSRFNQCHLLSSIQQQPYTHFRHGCLLMQILN